ncbi:unnamed protein product [Gongylonema pulchrum]|uniref:BHLH domain-containing protein n=1 Tax=Gongylonema pulchrum TaxID=637853 RepID=A0A183DCQ9_9BILA|nr:unnamed protein product [Gongylonema pulchrum]
MDGANAEIDEDMDDVEEKPMSSNATDSEDHLMSDVSGESQDSPTSGKSSIDEASGSSGAEQGSDKRERRRKAGLKLNEIAARLHEKNSPESPHSADVRTEIKCEVDFFHFLLTRLKR